MKQLLKQTFLVLAVSGTMVACKAKKDTGQAMVLSAADSAELKEFTEWKKAKSGAAKRTVVYVDRRTNETPAVATTEKKGWSNAAKGAAIGAGTGAVAGAIINKRNRAAGAVIGGVVGAGVGYGIGKSKDNKKKRAHQ